jgi:hypothetical protein
MRPCGSDLTDALASEFTIGPEMFATESNVMEFRRQGAGGGGGGAAAAGGLKGGGVGLSRRGGSLTRVGQIIPSGQQPQPSWAPHCQT